VTVPQRYRKKPVIIYAMRVDGDLAIMTISGWMMASGFHDFQIVGETRPFSMEIKTLEGVMRADMGDWVIKGTHGEFYPIKPEIFEANYEQVR
jgi:hypothetical protein